MSELSQFYYYEAELLDDRRLAEWLTLLTGDIDYRIPTRVTREKSSRERDFSVESFHMIEDLSSLTTRVRRFETDHAYAEDPRTRTRRIIGNIRPQNQAADGDLAVKSNFLLFRGKSGESDQLLAGERHDTLRREGTSLRLARRVVYLDHTVLPLDNLSIFL